MSDLSSHAELRPAHAADETDVDYYSGAYPPLPDAPTDEVDLSTDPFADNLQDELAAAAPKRWYDRATWVLGALALLVGGFLAGVQVEKHYAASTAATSARNAALSALANGGGFRNRGGGEGTGGGAGATPSASASAGQSYSGKITLVDGTTVYVTLTSGDVLTVRTTTNTKITVGTATKVSQLKAGESVTVTGAADSSGNVTATSITS